MNLCNTAGIGKEFSLMPSNFPREETFREIRDCNTTEAFLVKPRRHGHSSREAVASLRCSRNAHFTWRKNRPSLWKNLRPASKATDVHDVFPSAAEVATSEGRSDLLPKENAQDCQSTFVSIGKSKDGRTAIGSLGDRPDLLGKAQLSDASSVPQITDRTVATGSNCTQSLTKELRAAGNASLATGVSLIVGTAVGPGILGLPEAMIPAGALAAGAAVICSWVYVLASVLLVAELSCGLMHEQGTSEVSFTGIATRTLGPAWGQLAALLYTALNYALLAACIAGLGEMLAAATQGGLQGLPMFLPWFGPSVMAIAVTLLAGAALVGQQLSLLDAINCGLCALMLVALALLLAIGLPHVNFPMALSKWTPLAALPAVPVTVLTLGFHVVTPLVVSVMGGDAARVRNALLIGGAVPLVMVLAWNTVILGLTNRPPTGIQMVGIQSPLQLLLSLGKVGPIVQAFSIGALGTTLIGYSLSLPKQLADTAAMLCPPNNEESQVRVLGEIRPSKRVLAAALIPPLLLAVVSPATYQVALKFAGAYANCFLFGVLPPIMAWLYRYGSPFRGEGSIPGTRHVKLVPGGKPVLAFLLIIALYLGLSQTS